MESERGRRKTLVGVVVSNKMDKTAVVAVERRYPHPLYKKIVRRTKKYKAHDAQNTAVLGDIVRLEETRPLSKEKRWRIAETLVRGNVAEVAPREIGVPELPPEPAPAPAAAEPVQAVATEAIAAPATESSAEPVAQVEAAPPAEEASVEEMADEATEPSAKPSEEEQAPE